MRTSRLGVGALCLGCFGLLGCGSDSGDEKSSTGGAGGSTGGVAGAAGASTGGGSGGVGTGGAGGLGGGAGTGGSSGAGHAILNVFVIVMENHSWSTIQASKSAPYINDTLVKTAAHADQYYTPPGLHPSEPNYIWLEAGDAFGIKDDNDPDKNHQATTDHLVNQLTAAGISWKAYAEDISGTECPLKSAGLYGAKHTPQIYFDDVTGVNDPKYQYCIDHVRPFSELAADLTSGNVARYNFITPNLCNDMHGEVLGLQCNSLTANLIQIGDGWLAKNVPMITASKAYENGVLFVVWDEGDENLISGASDGPIPMFVLSPFAKVGYANSIKYTHSSMLRTFEEIFGVPLLRDAKNATNLSDFFTTYP